MHYVYKALGGMGKFNEHSTLHCEKNFDNTEHCTSNFGETLFFSHKTMKGGMSFIFGASQDPKSANIDSLIVRTFHCVNS